jgi:fused signal recognition particle receptor
MFKLFGSKKSDEKPIENSLMTLSEEKEGGLSKLKAAVSLTGKALIDRIVSLGGSDERLLSAEVLEEIEEILIRADVGLDLAVQLTDKIRENQKLQTQEALREFLKNEFTHALVSVPQTTELCYVPGKLNLYLIVGVNGAGKTTLIGKMANRFTKAGKKVIIAAADTFRAAAEEQLEIWAQRAGAELVRKDNADAAAVVFDSIKQAKEQQTDVLIIDTAGRLQNKFNLMEELKKIKRIIERELPQDSVYEALLVIDATTGQNALRQTEVFKEAVDLTGVALTKLDGSAKGGIVFNIAMQYHLPVKLIGVGEKIDDIRDFNPTSFIEALFTQ